MVKIALGGKKFVFWEVGKMKVWVAGLLLNDLSHAAWVKSRCVS